MQGAKCALKGSKIRQRRVRANKKGENTMTERKQVTVRLPKQDKQEFFRATRLRGQTFQSAFDEFVRDYVLLAKSDLKDGRIRF